MIYLVALRNKEQPSVPLTAHISTLRPNPIEAYDVTCAVPVLDETNSSETCLRNINLTMKER